MTALMIAAAIVTGLVVGWWVTLNVALAAMSRSQARMQRKVRYWQAEAGRAQATAEQFTQATLEQLVAPEKW
jgi:type II secretory pathway component PulJ